MNNIPVYSRQFTFLSTLLFISLLFFTSSSVLAVGGGEAKTIHDSQGNTILIEKPFSRIISLYSAHTENLCSIGAASQLVGISRSDDYPEDILTKPRFSYREDPEKFIAHNPDLVLIRPMVERSYPEFIKKLRAAGITVISLQPTNIDEMLDYWKTSELLQDMNKKRLLSPTRLQLRSKTLTMSSHTFPKVSAQKCILKQSIKK